MALVEIPDGPFCKGKGMVVLFRIPVGAIFPDKGINARSDHRADQP